MTLKGKLFAWGLVALTALGLLEIKARADYDVTVGSGTTIFAFTCFTSKVCPVHTQVKSDGTEVTYAAGNVGASTPRITLATDDAAIAQVVSALGASIPAGSNLIGGVNLAAAASGGCTPRATIASTASTNATSAVAATSTLCGFTVLNTTTTVYYLHFYNTAGTPSCGSSIIQTYPIPPASAAGQVGGLSKSFGAYGAAWATGIGICITSAADGTGSAATGVYLNMEYKS